MSDIVEIRKAFGRADVKEVWLSVPTLLDEVDRLRAINAELLAALKWIAEDDGGRAGDEARAAIAKAKGE